MKTIFRGHTVKISFNNLYKPSFGYDNKLNKELISILKSYPKDYAKTLTDMNKVCNSLEKDLKKSEKSNSFANKEFNYYQDEFVRQGAKRDNRRLDICNYLNDWCKFSKVKEFDKIDPAQVVFIDSKDDEYNGDTDAIPASCSASSEKHLNSAEGPKLRKNSLLEEFVPKSSSPNGFSDVAGMDKVKKDLTESIVKMINNPEQTQLDLEEYGKKIPRAILLYGPPGCGKTYISEALSAEISVPLYMFSIGKAGSSYVNATSKNIKSAFDEAISIAGKSKKPVLVFMDEIDSIAFDRNDKTWPEDIKQVATLLQAVDEAEESGVIILAATNKYQLLDPAVKRRFTSRIFVDVPDEKARIALLQKQLSSVKKGRSLAENTEALTVISQKLDGYSNDSICKITYDASMNALSRSRAEIDVQDFEKAIKETTEEKPDREDYFDKNKPKQIKGFIV